MNCNDINQLKNHTAHKESGAGIQVSGFYCNSTVIFFWFISFPIQIFINMQIARIT